MIAEQIRMGKPLPRQWQDLVTTDFPSLDRLHTVALLPVAAIEQHGPHLPVSTDAVINQGIVDRALELLPAGLPVLVLPMQSIGKSDEHIDFPGTLTHSAETLMRSWIEIGASVARARVRKLVLLNSHGGQIAPMQIVVRELRVAHGMLAVAASWFAFGTPPGLVDPDELRHGIHGGTIETSMMLALRPDLVRMEQAADFRPWSFELARSAPRLAGLGAAGFGWQTQDLHSSGACGDARPATAELGEACLTHAARVLAELLNEVSELDLPYIDEQDRSA
jgi:creatinine amidohydrolase